MAFFKMLKSKHQPLLSHTVFAQVIDRLHGGRLSNFSLALSCILAIFILSGPFVQPSSHGVAYASGLSAPTNFDITSLLGLNDLANETLTRIDRSMGIAQGALHDELEQLHTQVANIIGQFETTYKDMLNASVSSLDTETQRVATEIANTLDDINTKMESMIQTGQDALTEAVRDTRTQLSQLTSQLEDTLGNVIAIATESALFIVDRAAWNALGSGAVLVLLAGIVSIVIVIIWAKGWPRGIGGSIAGILLVVFVVGGAAVAFVPTVKAQALKVVGKSNEVPTVDLVPSIFQVDPNPVILGVTDEVNIIGARLVLNGVRPQVTIDGIPVEIRGAGEGQITIAVPTEGQSRTVQLTLTYESTDIPSVGHTLQLLVPTPVPQPALISLENFTVSPSNPIAKQDIVSASVTVINSGDLPSNEFVLTWIPMPNQGQYSVTIASLAPHASRTVQIPQFTYPVGGQFSTSVQNNSNQMGSNPSILTTQLNVLPPPPTATPPPPLTSFEDFTVNVYASNGPFFEGECRPVDTTHRIPNVNEWRIDRSKGDPNHPGISEIANNSNNQSNSSLRGYNYQPDNDIQITVIGRICGAGGSGPGAIFNRTYRIYLIHR